MLRRFSTPVGFVNQPEEDDDLPTERAPPPPATMQNTRGLQAFNTRNNSSSSGASSVSPPHSPARKGLSLAIISLSLKSVLTF